MNGEDEVSLEETARSGWEDIREWYRGLRRRLSLRPRDLTPADIVPADAEPICPSCVIPYHPAAARCPNCGEIVSRYATSMAYVWILVWGPKLQRVVRQERLSRLLCAGLLVSGILYASDLIGIFWVLFGGSPVFVLMWVLAAIAEVGAGIRMFEAAVRGWGTWREAETVENRSVD